MKEHLTFHRTILIVQNCICEEFFCPFSREKRLRYEKCHLQILIIVHHFLAVTLCTYVILAIITLATRQYIF